MRFEDLVADLIKEARKPVTMFKFRHVEVLQQYDNAEYIGNDTTYFYQYHVKEYDNIIFTTGVLRDAVEYAAYRAYELRPINNKYSRQIR